MTASRLAAIILIVLGVLALAYQGISYTTQEKVVEVGPLKATVEKEKRIPLPPIVGAVAVVGGIVLLIARGLKGASGGRQVAPAREGR